MPNLAYLLKVRKYHMKEKPLEWIGSSKKDLIALSDDVIDEIEIEYKIKRIYEK
jgi:phage-related protein